MFDDLTRPNKNKKLSVYLIFGAISLVFVFMGMDTGSNSIGGHAAIVNNKAISIREFRSSYDQLSNYYRQMLGNQFGANSQQRMMLQQQAMSQLINQELVAQVAPSIGVYFTDSELGEVIRNIPAFQEDGFFRKDFYKRFLEQRRVTPGQFEKELRRDMLFRKTRNYVASSLEPTNIQVELEKKARSHKVDIDYVEFTDSAIRGNIKASDKELKAFESNEESMKELMANYEKNKAEYMQEEEVKARHILIKATKGDAKSEQAAKEKMDNVLKNLSIDNFSEMAKKFSEDPGSKEKGGDLGYFKKGAMVKEFEAQAFNLKKAQKSPVFQTDFGFHVLVVDDKKEARQIPFEEMKLTLIKEKLAKTLLDNFYNDLETGLKEGNSKDVEKLIKKAGLSWKNTGEFNMTSAYVPKVGAIDSFIDAAFSINSKNDLYNELVKNNSTKYVLRLKSKKVDNSNMEDESIKAQLGNSLLQEAFTGWTKSLRETAEIQENAKIYN